MLWSLLPPELSWLVVVVTVGGVILTGEPEVSAQSSAHLLLLPVLVLTCLLCLCVSHCPLHKVRNRLHNVILFIAPTSSQLEAWPYQ